MEKKPHSKRIHLPTIYTSTTAAIKLREIRKKKSSMKGIFLDPLKNKNTLRMAHLILMLFKDFLKVPLRFESIKYPAATVASVWRLACQKLTDHDYQPTSRGLMVSVGRGRPSVALTRWKRIMSVVLSLISMTT